jgi:uncharacterized protein with GYD domain
MEAVNVRLVAEGGQVTLPLTTVGTPDLASIPELPGRAKAAAEC